MLPDYDYHLAGGISKDSTCERDLEVNILPSMPPKHHIRIVYVVRYLVINIKTVLKYMKEKKIR